ncbi:isoleucyl-tRNA synthetase [Weissella uvarum]|uniref:isoleucine--tRNA ligase n=1 Tax=Weissella uvarum TaxID=1479233 RepID=UPI0019606101|nr:isoleucine--tRNA ligase [Weissella uvarum]MBM7617783.1 isoleucyl-tRNA synthetase [Weissella uvarum]MCM0595838.1 isoleucine--tRNA ligase [Weissella uvarum]
MKIKETLNLGKTKFPMRGNLPQKEAERENVWFENKVYEQRQRLNEGKPSFMLHDGPPYANGNIHIGHAMNKISKDIIVRYKSMNGYYAPFVPGWDTHGLPIEQQLTKAGKNRKEAGPVKWRKMAAEFADKQVKTQMADFKRLGISADWDHPYITKQPEYEAAQLRVFGKMADRGLIYRGKKPVFWSWSSESAMAMAEIEYHDVTSTSVAFSERVKDGKGVLDNDTYFIVWTTTPWTIPASEAIAVNPNFTYDVVRPAGSEKKYVVAEARLAAAAADYGWDDYEVVQTVKGSDLDRLTAQHPYMDRDILVINGEHVTADAGTGLVHTAPGFGEDDFAIGQAYDLPILMNVDDRGYLTEEAGPDFDGVFYEDANAISLKKLEEADALIKAEEITHSYPFDWRTKKPVIFRAVPQWFASIEPIRQEILDSLDDVEFQPEWGRKRLANMIRDRGDWVISRQRVWGVPLPIFYAEDGTPILEQALVEHVADLVEKHGSDIWFERDAKDLLPEGYTNEHSPHGEFTKEKDIMDVWFDSGSSHTAVMEQRPELSFPEDVVLEGSDQYRGWFNSSLITSVAIHDRAPYRRVISQGFTLDGNGDKMSKSVGNTVSPNEITKKMGAEIIRLWVTSVDTSGDVRVSEEILSKTSEVYRKIRNTMRYLLSNTSDFNPNENTVAYADLVPVDQYFYAHFNNVVKDMKAAYDAYDFQQVYKLLNNFINVDLSAFYLDFAKDILYVEAPNGHARRSLQTVLYKILVDLDKLILPILPHTAEEIFDYMPYETADFAYLTEMPTVEDLGDVSDLLARWEQFMDLRNAVNKALEVARDDKLIGKPSEAAVTLYLTDSQKALIDSLGQDIRVLLMISQLHLESAEQAGDASDFDGYLIKVEHAAGEVSPRDRMYHLDIGADPDFPMLSAHEAEIVRENYPEALTEGLEA